VIGYMSVDFAVAGTDEKEGTGGTRAGSAEQEPPSPSGEYYFASDFRILSSSLARHYCPNLAVPDGTI
jgi:hypothetical protein